MVPEPHTAGSWLAHLLATSAGGVPAPNVRVLAPAAPESWPAAAGERVVAVVASVAGGPDLLLTATRVLAGGRVVLRYADVARCDWAAVDPSRRVDPQQAAHLFGLTVRLAGGGRAELEGLGHAVYPLYQFFQAVAWAS